MSDAVVFPVGTGERPLLLNDERTKHWTTRTRLVAPWAAATHNALTEHRIKARYCRVAFTFLPVYPKGGLPDVTATYPVTKAIVDALAEAGVIPDDNPPHSAQETHRAPMLDPSVEWPLIMVGIQPVDPVEGHGPGECECGAALQHQLAKRALGRR